MRPIMAGRRQAFLDRLTFRPVVPAVAGLALLILSLLAQVHDRKPGRQ
jgi:hypothetical protein